ncbi:MULTISPECIES: hypothetical protein [Allobacillus]|uniref:Uncharacterized protein n=1 Tax=Allobacillus salarius TaxID=1955272 RepID=A0A556PGI1_9BACI|nr:hypothetical protein [Allobacillus salarius]TSJ63488.1 hypothetical protein FPQ13_09125 [Allobacillus salarius]
MNLIDVYIQEVTRRLPEKNRADIGLELRSTIEDTLPDDYDEEDVNTVLQELGNPAALASEYRDQPMHLIGPRYFDIYVSLLKMIVPIAAVVALISMIAKYFGAFGEEEAILNAVLHIIGEGIWVVIQVGIQVFFWLTLVFAILERTDKGKYGEPLATNFKKWTPNDLKNVAYISGENSITKLRVFGSLMWTTVWATLYFYANQLIGVYEGSEVGLEFVMPALTQGVLMSYWPLVLVVILLEVSSSIYKLIIGKWTTKIAIFNTVIELISTSLFIVILSNPNLFQPEFLSYMSDLFNISSSQFKFWLVGGAIIILVLSATISIFDGFRRALNR